MRKIDPERHQARRQHILEAATACFRRKGFHQTSTAEICAAAGMSPGNLFHYFPTKQAIIAAIVEQERLETRDYFSRAAAQDDLFEEIARFLDLILTLAADAEFVTLALEIAAEAQRDARIGALVAQNDREMREAIAGLLAGAVARRQIDPATDPTAMADWIAALVDGIFHRVASDPDFRPLGQQGMARLMLTRMLAAEPRP